MPDGLAPNQRRRAHRLRLQISPVGYPAFVLPRFVFRRRLFQSG